jgi:hypothetical protein
MQVYALCRLQSRRLWRVWRLHAQKQRLLSLTQICSHICYPLQAAESPFFGVYGGYTRKTDPWRNSLPPNVLSDTRQYLEVWYRAAALWLKRKGGPRWRVDHVFLWNLNSWDVQVGYEGLKV